MIDGGFGATDDQQDLRRIGALAATLFLLACASGCGRSGEVLGHANFAHDVLIQAQPDLLEKGCNVGPLL